MAFSRTLTSIFSVYNSLQLLDVLFEEGGLYRTYYVITGLNRFSPPSLASTLQRKTRLKAMSYLRRICGPKGRGFCRQGVVFSRSKPLKSPASEVPAGLQESLRVFHEGQPMSQIFYATCQLRRSDWCNWELV